MGHYERHPLAPSETPVDLLKRELTPYCPDHTNLDFTNMHATMCDSVGPEALPDMARGVFTSGASMQDAQSIIAQYNLSHRLRSARILCNIHLAGTLRVMCTCGARISSLPTRVDNVRGCFCIAKVDRKKVLRRYRHNGGPNNNLVILHLCDSYDPQFCNGRGRVNNLLCTNSTLNQVYMSAVELLTRSLCARLPLELVSKVIGCASDSYFRMAVALIPILVGDELQYAITRQDDLHTTIDYIRACQANRHRLMGAPVHDPSFLGLLSDITPTPSVRVDPLFLEYIRGGPRLRLAVDSLRGQLAQTGIVHIDAVDVRFVHAAYRAFCRAHESRQSRVYRDIPPNMRSYRGFSACLDSLLFDKLHGYFTVDDGNVFGRVMVVRWYAKTAITASDVMFGAFRDTRDMRALGVLRSVLTANGVRLKQSACVHEALDVICEMFPSAGGAMSTFEAFVMTTGFLRFVQFFACTRHYHENLVLPPVGGSYVEASSREAWAGLRGEMIDNVRMKDFEYDSNMFQRMVSVLGYDTAVVVYNGVLSCLWEDSGRNARLMRDKKVLHGYALYYLREILARLE